MRRLGCGCLLGLGSLALGLLAFLTVFGWAASVINPSYLPTP